MAEEFGVCHELWIELMVLCNINDMRRVSACSVKSVPKIWFDSSNLWARQLVITLLKLPPKSLIGKCIRKLDFVTNVTDFLAVQDGNKNLIFHHLVID